MCNCDYVVAKELGLPKIEYFLFGLFALILLAPTLRASAQLTGGTQLFALGISVSLILIVVWSWLVVFLPSVAKQVTEVFAWK